MNAAAALAELGELERFLAALNAQQLHGDHICCAAQPETTNGSPETLVEQGVREGAAVTARWADQLVAGIGDADTESQIRSAIGYASARFDLQAFADVVEQGLLRGLMLGALDSEWERENDQDVAPATFAAAGVKSQLVYEPFTKAVELFETRQVLPPAAFKALKDGAQKHAFTVAGLAKQELLNAAHAELAKQLRQARETKGKETRGIGLRGFQRFAKERLESAGWTPTHSSHVETIFRTNIVSAVSSGRNAEMTQPKVLAALPYWQILTVRDARQRPTHRDAHGIVLLASDPFWRKAYPPFGYNCRCRVCARSKAWLERESKSVGPVPKDLPDKGFTSGTSQLISAPPATLAEPAKPMPVAVPVPKPILAPAPPPLPPWYKPPVAPPPAPVLPPPRLPASDVDLLAKKLADAKGSNPGGIYEGSDGVKRYVKFYKDPAQAAGEHLANSLYRDLGLAGAKSELFIHEGKLAHAAELIPGTSTLGSKLTAARAKKALDGFSADVLTANWDAAGLTLDNMLVDAKGKIIRIDNGAAFLTRAQGARKPLEALGKVTEWESFFSPSRNPGYAKLASKAGVASAVDLAPSIKRGVVKILKVRDKAGGWRQYVDQRSKGLSIADREQIIGMLETRTAFLQAKVAEIEALALQPKPARTLASLVQGELPAARRSAVRGLEHGEWLKQVDQRLQMLTSTERRAITTYTGSDYSLIRDAHFLTPEQWYDKWSKLRSVGTDDYFRYQQLATHIDQSFAKLAAVAGPEAKVTEVYRGMRNMSHAQVEQIISSPAFEWQGLTSSSWGVGQAENFASHSEHGKMGIMFVMRTRAETAANRLGIEPVSGIQGEREILLQRGARFKITEVKRLDSSRVVVYGDELLPGEVATVGDAIKLTA